MADLTLERLSELRRIAEAATPGPWWVDGWEARTKDGDRFIASIAPAFQGASPDASCWEVDANIQHIAAFDPTTALELLDALTAARAETERWREKYEALKAGIEELIRHVRMVLPEVVISSSATKDERLQKLPTGRVGR
ncbi:MAG: hypothetical protein DIU79_16255 [Actinobacteria bacterium]|nr:MAG: hypothetical protein DIU79_16255 [Actinomycetota bacterium]